MEVTAKNIIMEDTHTAQVVLPTRYIPGSFFSRVPHSGPTISQDRPVVTANTSTEEANEYINEQNALNFSSVHLKTFISYQNI
jgi:hypothetical protein